MKLNQILLLALCVVFLNSCKYDVESISIDSSNQIATNMCSKALIFKPNGEDTEFQFAGKKFDNKKYILNIVEQIKAGKIKAYKDDELKSEFSIADFINIISPPGDTQDVESLDQPGKYEMKIIANEFSPENFNQLWFKENWNFDDKTGKFTKSIDAIGFAQEVINPDGSLKGIKLPFFIKNN